MKATIYKIYPSLMTNGNYGYTLTKPESDTDTIYDEHVYDLPDGYTVDRNTSNQLMIFDPNGDGCELVGNKAGNKIKLISTKNIVQILDDTITSTNYATIKDENIIENKIIRTVKEDPDDNLVFVNTEPVADWENDDGANIREYKVIETLNCDGMWTEKKYYMRVTLESDGYIQVDKIPGRKDQ